MEQELISSVRYLGVVPMVIVALMLVLKRRGRHASVVYDRSRWMLVAATMLLAVHFLIQYVGHLREQSVTLCWSVNLAFYVVITPLYNMAELNLLRVGHDRRRSYRNNVLSLVIFYALFAVGFLTGTLVNDAQPWRTMTFVVAVLYFLKLLELSWVLGREMKASTISLTPGEQSERSRALRYTGRVMGWIILCSLFTPWVSMSSSLLLNAVYGTIFFIFLIWFQVKFMQLGEPSAQAQPAAVRPQVADEVQPQDVQQRVEQWVSLRRYTNAELTIAEALQEMGVTAEALNRYLERHTSVKVYRKWLPYLRIEEAKRIMLEHPEYSLDAVAEACGYANKSNLSRAFKAQEGVTPSVWMKNCQGE